MPSDIKIEKGVPVSRPKNTKWPFKDMEVGDSFLAEGRNIQSMAGVVGYYRRLFPDMRFVTRTVEGGVRVWRTE